MATRKTCNATGGAVCALCKGTGKLYNLLSGRGMFDLSGDVRDFGRLHKHYELPTSRTCDGCHGSGKVRCAVCNGTGQVR